MHKKKFLVREYNRDAELIRETEVDTYNDLMNEASGTVAGIIGNGENIFDTNIHISNTFEYDGLVKTEVIGMVIQR